ncbi:MAG: transaldolase [Calditrichaeota bacterium]|nr:transaldolase [Calditrichota bacterium]RQW01761.1 MAG: transaldolase [Calditrichota bacterium]
MNPILKLIDYGQSYWLDNLSRHMIKTGALKKRITEEGLRGMTSNPNIFDKAISNSDAYDDQIRELVKQKKSVDQIYEALVVKDVQDACDLFRPVYDESNGLDGYVSLEVSPYLARHTERTMDEARRLFSKVNRPNCLIKIPGTVEGLAAIEQMLYEGININITLLFSIKRYEEVAEAYMRAMERRFSEGKNLSDITSVASFFLSRIDVLTDKLLHHRILPEDRGKGNTRAEQLLGKAAIASAKLAYQSFKKIFSGDRWEKLADNGARLQRPLWASTSTKNPKYSDVMYVEPLIAENTVNTMPEETIDAFADHGQIAPNTVEEDLDESRKHLKMLDEVGINLDYVTQQLEDEGIQKFIDPFRALLKTIEDAIKTYSS